MKKLLVVLLAVIMVFGTLALVACDTEVVETAYGRVHSKYAGKATVTVKDGKIISATLDEACGPTQVKAPTDGSVAADYIAGGYYKTAKFLDKVWVYDVEAKEYKSGTTSFYEELLKAEFSKAYFEAAAAGQVKVVKDATTDVALTADQLLKSKNGYWSTNLGTRLGWVKNVEATVAYVVANGVNDSFTKESFTVKSAVEPKDPILEDSNGISTGATWVDFYDYYAILRTAFKAVK